VLSEVVNRRRTDNTSYQRKRTEDKHWSTQHYTEELNIEQHETHCSMPDILILYNFISLIHYHKKYTNAFSEENIIFQRFLI
jgi:hypothetical protein